MKTPESFSALPWNNFSINRMYPSEMKDLRINFGYYQTPYGESLIASTPKGICYIAFGEREEIFNELAKRYSGAAFRFAADKYQERAAKKLNNETEISNTVLPFHIHGTDFQIKVWETLLHIPFAQLVTYRQIAENIGNPKANRAVGSAIGHNPIAYLIPCHRVIRSDGKPGDYHWGANRKVSMIESESRHDIKKKSD